MTATHMRTPETMKKYATFNAERLAKIEGGEKVYPAYDDPNEPRIAEFKYWYILDNFYPYDTIAEVHHIIVLKRHVALKWSLLNQEERDELEELKVNGYINKHYDTLLENLPVAQTVPGRFHLHLILLKRFEVKDLK